MKKLWDNYYIPSIYGYFGAYGKFRSDDTKVGDLLAFVGSSSSAGYFPKEVFVNEDESYPIDAIVLQAPVFEGGEPCAVQQGAGMAVLQSTREQEYAAVQFMKWFTQEEEYLLLYPLRISAGEESGPFTGKAGGGACQHQGTHCGIHAGGA